MPKRKTTILIDDKIWKRLLSFTIQKHGTAKKTSEEIEKAVEEHLANPKKHESKRKRTRANSENLKQFQESEKTFRAR
ncbi:MAG: hypothetical protein ABIH76_00030 [Candidatus Bathyarchaeota archaeon]